MVILVFVALISGCGSGGGSFVSAGVGTGGTGSLAKSISGKVADGYLVNATVFLDRNGNYQLDEGEPSTITDAYGAYTLNVDSADVGRYAIVALATKGVTIDRDTDQAVTDSYVLSMPKDSVSSTASSNFISPITSLVREIMETGIVSTVQQAADALRTKMGLPSGTDIMNDYIAANNTDIHATARNTTALMGSQMDKILGTSGSNTTVDVNRYRGMMGTIFSNISSVRSPNTQPAISNLKNTIIPAYVQSIPPGQPFRNMSTTFRGGMTGGTGTSTKTGTSTGTSTMTGGGKMGGASTSTSTSTGTGTSTGGMMR